MDFLPVNQDALGVPLSLVSSGKRLGFLGAFEAQFDEASKYSSQFGAEVMLRDDEQENVQRVRRAGGKAPKLLDNTENSVIYDTTPYADYMRAMQSEDDNGIYARLGDRDDQLRALQRQYPDAGIRTYEEMYSGVRDRARSIVREAQRDTTVMGAIGGFVGGMAGAVDPRTNPLNFATLGVGGFGQTAARRIAVQGFGQGAIEAVNQFTGARENQRMLGGDPTLASSFAQIGGAAIGGAVIQGVGEGLAWGVGRWFRSTPADVAPEPPAPVRPAAAPANVVPAAPVVEPPARAVGPAYDDWLIRGAVTGAFEPQSGAGRRSAARAAAADVEHAAVHLNAWDGPEPWRIPPPTSTRLPTLGDPGANAPRIEVKYPSLDDAARAVDPETFRVWDKLTAQQERFRGLVARINEALNNNPAYKALLAQADDLRGQLTRARSDKSKAAIQTRLTRVERDMEDMLKGAPVVAQRTELQERLVKIDADMRDLAPTVSRAYARAESKWGVHEARRADIERSLDEWNNPDTTGMRRVEKGLPAEPPPEVFTPRPRFESVPELKAGVARVNPDKPAVDEVARVMQEQKKIIDDAIADIQSRAPKLIEAKGEEAVIELEGRQVKLNLDEKLVVDNAAGDGTREVSVRQLMREITEDNDKLQAVTTCSVGKTS